jgi:two-component system response regulator YesN
MWTVLVADDERTIREGIAGSIDWKALNVSRVLLAADGREAFDIITKERPHVAILDIVMPEMTGIEVIARFQEDEASPEFVIISGYSEFDYAQEAIRYNVRDYILKPCDPDEIRATLHKIIAKIEHRLSIEKERACLRQYVDSLVQPAQEQVLRDYLSGDLADDGERFRQVFGQPCQEFKLLLFSVSRTDDLAHLPTLKKCVKQNQAVHGWRFVTTMRDSVVLLYDASSDTDARKVTTQVCKAAAQAHIAGVRAAVSSPGTIKELPKLYEQAWEALRHYSPFRIYSNAADLAPLIDASTSKYSDPVRRVIEYVKEYLGDSSLSLSRIAKEVLYLNPDYLGRLFKKECGVRFSEYLMAARMEEAMRIMECCKDMKIYEIAELVGLGDNAAYFGQLFRKYTGVRPSEYRTRLSRHKARNALLNPGQEKPLARDHTCEPTRADGQS